MSRLSGMRFEGLSPAGWATLSGTTIETHNITVPGAKLGDLVLVTIEHASPAVYMLSARVSAADTVSVQVMPDGGSGGVPTNSSIYGIVVPRDTI